MINVIKISLFIIFVTSGLSAKSTFSGERIKEACENYIYSIVGKDAEIQITNNVNNIEFNSDGITAKCKSQENSLSGNTYVVMDFYESGKLIRSINIPVRIKLFKDVPVAETNIPHGTELNSTNMSLKKVDITNYKSNDILSFNDISGAKANRYIKQGSIIIRGMVYSLDRINRGEKVTLFVRSGSVSIRSSGVALNDAEPGQDIRVKRDGNNVILSGIADKDKTVILNAR